MSENPEETGGTKEEASDKEEVAIDVAQENNAETPQEDAPENSEEQPQSEVKPDIASESGEVAGDSENSTQQKSAYVVADNVKDTSDVANPDQDVVDPGANSEEAQKKVYTDTRLDELLGSYNSEFDESKPETRCAISFEYYPPRTTESLKNLYEKMERMKTQKPLYCSVTWGAGGSTAKVSLDIAKVLKGKFEIVPNLHLTCTNMEKHIIKETLDDCRLLKIKNVMALRGEEAKESSEDEATEFSSAIDLIRYMRENYEEHEFCIQTAGYPEGHGTKINKIDNPKMLTENEKKRIVHRPDADYVCHEEEYQQEIDYLKEKVDAGANIIVTQFFFDVQVYIHFVEKCREAGIDVPIVPGIMIILAYGSFKRIQDFSRCRVPDDIAEKLESLKKDASGFREYGIELATNMCKELIEYGVPGLHFYTLNMEKSVNEVLKNIGRFIGDNDKNKKGKEADVKESTTDATSN